MTIYTNITAMYYGYILANENIAAKVAEYFKDIAQIEETLDLVVEQYSHLPGLIRYLGENGYARQSDIAKHLGISPSWLSNLFNTPEIKKLDLFVVQKIGRNALYGLSNKGKDYYVKKMKDWD